MSASEAGAQKVAPVLAELRNQYLVSTLGKAGECLEEARLLALANEEQPATSQMERGHLLACIRCASLLASFRTARVEDAMPERWHVRLREIRLSDTAEDGKEPYQVLGRISLEKQQFEQTMSEESWQSHPLCVRVNLVLDADTDDFSLTLLEVPDAVSSIAVRTPMGWEPLEATDPLGTYELVRSLSAFCPKGQDSYPLASFFDYVEAGLLQIEFAKASAVRRDDSSPRPENDASLLGSFSALEEDYDYELPCGLHAGTHVNVGKLCRTEDALHVVAAAVNALFRDVAFDTVATNGWAMATIARRLAALRSAQTACGPITDIMFEGYNPPLPVEDIVAGSRVLVLVDVVITGGLVRRLEEAVSAVGGQVVASGCLVASGCQSATTPQALRSLFRVDLGVAEPGVCSRCATLERRVYNPFAGCMTARAPGPRSPSEFLRQSPSASEFWERVNKVGAYQHHKVEGNRHFTAFVDTRKLLVHDEVGPVLIEELRDVLAENQVFPDVILAPNRIRSRLLATALKGAFGTAVPGKEVLVTFATRHAGRWRLADEDSRKLEAAEVLLIDSAAGHGKTLDHLALLAGQKGARGVAAAVLLSRLTEGCEKAFSARLSGGFHRLYHLPIRPVVIHGTSRKLCPVCQRRAAVHEAALESRIEAIERLDAWLSKKGRDTRSPRPMSVVMGAECERQPLLFSDPLPSLLETCGRAVASGVTLHSLYAAMTNGMAPLTLPEITNEAIPPANRAAMLENLPPGVVEWSRGVLDHDLERCLATAVKGGVWRASADVLAREKQAQWLCYLNAFLMRAGRRGEPPTNTFWNSMVCNAYLVSHQAPERTREVRARVEQLLSDYSGTAMAKGLQEMLNALTPFKVTDSE